MRAGVNVHFSVNALAVAVDRVRSNVELARHIGIACTIGDKPGDFYLALGEGIPARLILRDSTGLDLDDVDGEAFRALAPCAAPSTKLEQ